MIIAGFDTATDWLSLAVGDGDSILVAKGFAAPRGHMSLLLPTLRDALAEAELDISDVDHFAVGLGPGSFTGVRIGVATAQGLALGTGKPLVGVSTLDVLAAGVRQGQELVVPLLEAKRRELYSGVYGDSGVPPEMRGPLVVTPGEWARRLAGLGRPVLLTGDGLRAYSNMFTDMMGDRVALAEEDDWRPRAPVLLQLAKEKIEAGNVVKYEEVTPIYTRLSDAEEAAKRHSS